jgi:hypothetical protein
MGVRRTLLRKINRIHHVTNPLFTLIYRARTCDPEKRREYIPLTQYHHHHHPHDMATDQRVALTRAGRVASGNLPRAAQQVVPAFLQKLYKCVRLCI